MVFAGIYPVDTEESMSRIIREAQPNDAQHLKQRSQPYLASASVVGSLECCTWKSSERLEREFNMTVITTVPNVSYKVYMKSEPEKAIWFKTQPNFRSNQDGLHGGAVHQSANHYQRDWEQ